MKGLVVRKWEATIARSDVARWKETFLERVLPYMKSVDGFKGVNVFVERDVDPCRMTVQTRWRDIAAIVKFAGERPEQTYLPDFMAPFFQQYDEVATFHDEVLAEGAV